MKVNVNLQSILGQEFQIYPFRTHTKFYATVHNGNSQRLSTLVRIPLYHNIGNMYIVDGNGRQVEYKV